MNNHERENYERNIRLLERKIEILTEQLMKYDIATPRQYVIENADITPIVQQELQQLRDQLKTEQDTLIRTLADLVSGTDRQVIIDDIRRYLNGGKGNV